MLARCVFAVWGAWLGAMGLATVLMTARVWNPNPIVPVGLAVLMAAAGIAVVIGASVRLIRGPRRARALAGLLVGTAPFWFLAGHILLAVRPAVDRHVPPAWASKVLEPAGRPLVELGARWFYPVRTRGKWVTMVGEPADDARAQVDAMDRHVEALMARLDRSATWPIVWYRGPLFGLQSCAIYDMAIGIPVGPYVRGADGLIEGDRHEVAHCVLTATETAGSDPPRVLVEGWAQANQGTPAEELADTAWNNRRRGLSLTLRQLVAPDWYWFSGPAAYNQGAPLVNYVLRVYGPERFLKLYTTCQQATFASDVGACLGVGLEELDAAYWADIERLVGMNPPARRWLKGLKLAPGVDSAAWDGFLADYFAAVERLVAPFDHVRLEATNRMLVAEEGGKEQNHHVERLTLLRSGPLARVRFWEGDPSERGEGAILAHPDHSLRVWRDLAPRKEPWTIRRDGMAFPEQAHQYALERVESAASDQFFDATHGGASLLEFPQNLKRAGLSTDYEIVTLDTTVRDGHRLVTLRLRTCPGEKGRKRNDYTFVFDADDLFIARSLHYEDPDGGFVSDVRFTYEYPDGHPALRSTVATIAKEHRTLRVDVEQCRFGPIPDSEFAFEPFLASLGPDRPDWQPAAESPSAPLLGWCRLAFLGGGISLVGGAGLALRNRERQIA